jgi:hypothetical protein
MGKSAEVIDGKGVGKSSSCKRVRNCMKRKTLHDDTAFGGIDPSKLRIEMSRLWPFIIVIGQTNIRPNGQE